MVPPSMDMQEALIDWQDNKDTYSFCLGEAKCLQESRTVLNFPKESDLIVPAANVY
jgi:hypothetical protein